MAPLTMSRRVSGGIASNFTGEGMGPPLIRCRGSLGGPGGQIKFNHLVMMKPKGMKFDWHTVFCAKSRHLFPQGIFSVRPSTVKIIKRINRQRFPDASARIHRVECKRFRRETRRGHQRHIVFVRDWEQHSGKCGFLNPYLDLVRRILPKVLAVQSGRIFQGILPTIETWGFVHVPRAVGDGTVRHIT